MITTIVILSILLIAAIIFIWRLVLRNEVLEETLEESDVQVNYYESKFVDIQQSVLDMQVRLKDIDILGSFAADDEVGFVFKEIQLLNDDLLGVINNSYEKSESE